MTTFFISDLHLQASQPQLNNLFKIFLHYSQIKKIDALYVLGDLFEAWIGDDDNPKFLHELQPLMKSLAAQTPCYLMPGNRDFLLGKRFAEKINWNLLTDPTVINLYGTPTLLMHGDSLCTHDLRYMQYRQFIRNPKLLLFLQHLPLWIRRTIARTLRLLSRRHTQSAQVMIMDVAADAVQNIMQQYHVTRLIHGHTHRPAIHDLKVNDNPAQRIVLGAWHNLGSVLICEADGSVKLQDFSEE